MLNWTSPVFTHGAFSVVNSLKVILLFVLPLHPWLKVNSLIEWNMSLRAIFVFTSSCTVKVTFITFHTPYISHMKFVLVITKSKAHLKFVGEIRYSMNEGIVKVRNGSARSFSVVECHDGLTILDLNIQNATKLCTQIL